MNKVIYTILTTILYRYTIRSAQAERTRKFCWSDNNLVFEILNPFFVLYGEIVKDRLGHTQRSL